MSTFPQLDAFRGGNGVVRLVGHRGARGIMPENTMEGFEFTIGIGVDALEFDVVLTRDRVPVITHNHTLLGSATRHPDQAWIQEGDLKVSQMNFADLQALDVGGLDGETVYGKRFPDQAFLCNVRIPRLTDLLELANRPGMERVCLLLELKSDPEAKGDTLTQRDVVEAVLAEVREQNLEQRTLLHSFDWDLLDECRRQAPEMPTSFLSELPANLDGAGEESSKSVGPDYAALTTSLPQAVYSAGGQMWCPYFQDVSHDLVAEAHDLGLLVTTWTVNEIPDIERVIDAGVDGIVSDYPGRAQRCILSKGMHWEG